ncbi:MAG: hypothetical protein WCS90_01755 [Bacilli bacterium]
MSQNCLLLVDPLIEANNSNVTIAWNAGRIVGCIALNTLIFVFLFFTMISHSKNLWWR